MRKSLVLALAFMTLVTLAQANDVPDGKAALVQAVLGTVKADQGQGFKKIKLGDDLAPGSTIKTGNTGRATLLLVDGSTARIAPNTELTIKDDKTRKGVFTRLFKGVTRFLVAKQMGGASFETELPSAVAAVKGTDPEYGTDGKTSYAKVFSSGNPVALLFTDTASGKSSELKAGEKLAFDGTEFKVEPITDKDREDSDKNYKGLPPVIEKEATPAAESTPAAAATPGTDDKKAEDKKDQSELDKATQEAMREATNELYRDGFLEKDERTGDIAAGKILIDRFGQRVQVTHFITRDDPQTVTVASYSKRDAGPNIGVSSAVETAKFNKELPTNWGPVYKVKFDDPSNLDASGYPIYFRKSEDFLAMNPSGDSFRSHTDLYDPDWYSSNTSGILEQGFDSTLTINGQKLLEIWAYDASAASNGNVSSCGINCGQNNYDFVNGYNYNGWNFNAMNNGNNWTIDLNFGSQGTVFSEDLTLLDDNGNILTHPTYTGIPALARNFAYSNGQLLDANIEMGLRSPLFNGRSIDVMFMPGFFNLYDMFNTGQIDYYGGS